MDCRVVFTAKSNKARQLNQWKVEKQEYEVISEAKRKKKPTESWKKQALH